MKLTMLGTGNALVTECYNTCFIPFKDHINVEAEGLVSHASDFEGCKFTSKGMLQIKANQAVDFERLKIVFSEILI